MIAAPMMFRSVLSAVFCLSLPHANSLAAADQGDVRQAIEEYCVAISDAAAEQRMASQTAALKVLETKVQEKIDKLAREKTELEALLKQRDELRNLAKKELVEIYAGMDPEAASQQMAQLDSRLAASVLRQLKPRQASAILNEMKPELAAKLAKMIASTAQAGKDTP
jgi:flagellar motility protein MotE (MotC chaperone)